MTLNHDFNTLEDFNVTNTIKNRYKESEEVINFILINFEDNLIYSCIVLKLHFVDTSEMQFVLKIIEQQSLAKLEKEDLKENSIGLLSLLILHNVDYVVNTIFSNSFKTTALIRDFDSLCECIVEINRFYSKVESLIETLKSVCALLVKNNNRVNAHSLLGLINIDQLYLSNVFSENEAGSILDDFVIDKEFKFMQIDETVQSKLLQFNALIINEFVVNDSATNNFDCDLYSCFTRFCVGGANVYKTSLKQTIDEKVNQYLHSAIESSANYIVSLFDTCVFEHNSHLVSSKYKLVDINDNQLFTVIDDIIGSYCHFENKLCSLKKYGFDNLDKLSAKHSEIISVKLYNRLKSYTNHFNALSLRRGLNTLQTFIGDINASSNDDFAAERIYSVVTDKSSIINNQQTNPPETNKGPNLVAISECFNIVNKLSNSHNKYSHPTSHLHKCAEYIVGKMKENKTSHCLYYVVILIDCLLDKNNSALLSKQHTIHKANFNPDSNELTRTKNDLELKFNSFVNPVCDHDLKKLIAQSGFYST